MNDERQILLQLKDGVSLTPGRTAPAIACIAEHDPAVGIDAVQRLDHEQKIYSKKMKGETGSVTYELQIRGGDTKFIVPVLISIGVIILGVILIITLK